MFTELSGSVDETAMEGSRVFGVFFLKGKNGVCMGFIDFLGKNTFKKSLCYQIDQIVKEKRLLVAECSLLVKYFQHSLLVMSIVCQQCCHISYV